MLTLIFRDISNQCTKLALVYISVSVHLKLLENKIPFKTPRQNHARKAKKTLNFHIEAKPYPDPVHSKSTWNFESTVERLYLGLPYKSFL